MNIFLLRRRYIFLLSILILSGTALLIEFRREAYYNQTETRAKLGAPLFNYQGYYHFTISSNSSLTQRYFDQGIIFFYSRNNEEAIRSFREAMRLDPQCAMCYWGLALALSSNRTSPMSGRERFEAMEAIRQSTQLSQSATPIEQAYIQALSSRFTEPTDKALLTYAVAMKIVVDQFPESIDAKNLYLAALFDATAPKLYTKNFQPLPNTQEMLDTIKAAFKIDPENSVTHYFHILATEHSEHPNQALASADFLRNTSHRTERFLHAPSRIYMLTGRYHDAVTSNKKAVAAYKEYIGEAWIQDFEPEKTFLFLQDLHFLWAAAVIEGRNRLALETANELVRQASSMPQENFEILYALPYFTKVRFNQWKAVLQEPTPKNSRYQESIWHYARGMAFTHLNDLISARIELSQLISLARLKSNDNSFNQGQLNIAVEVLEATISDHEGSENTMIGHWRKAAVLEDNLRLENPYFWYFQTKNGLAAALFKTKHFDEAESTYLQALQQYPENGWSLFGLFQTLQAQGKAYDAESVRQRLEKAWTYADHHPRLIVDNLK